MRATEKPKEEEKGHEHRLLTAPYPPGPGPLVLLRLCRRSQGLRGATATRGGAAPVPVSSC